jgi:hypothetical protein
MSTEHKIEEYEVVKTSPTGEFERREKIVEDEGVVRRQNVYRLTQFIWLVFGILEAALGLRFFLKLIAANPANPFAQLVYNFTDLFMWPFAGLTRTPSAEGMVLEIPVVIAMIIYALVAWVLVSIVGILFNRSGARKVTVYERRSE